MIMRHKPIGLMLRRSGRRIEWLAALLLLAMPSHAWAQAAAAPPQPTHGGRSAANWLGYLLIFVLLIIVAFVSLIPSKRGHQD